MKVDMDDHINTNIFVAPETPYLDTDAHWLIVGASL